MLKLLALVDPRLRVIGDEKPETGVRLARELGTHLGMQRRTVAVPRRVSILLAIRASERV